MEMEKEINQLQVNVARLEERVGNGFLHINSTLDDMKSNHLAHLQKSYESLDADYDKIKSTVDKMGVKLAFIMAGVSIAIQAGFQIFFK